METFWSGIRRLVREPVRITGLVMAFIGLGSAFDWWAVTGGQSDALLTFLGLLLIVVGFFVTPTPDPVLEAGTIVSLPNGDKARVEPFPTKHGERL